MLSNNPAGHKALVDWLLKTTKAPAQEIAVTLEPTGVYHEGLVYHLHAQGIGVFMANPGKAKAFARSQNQQNKTDKQDSVMLARYGCKCSDRLVLWQPEPVPVRQLRAMIRRLDMLEQDLRREQNREESAQISGASSRVIVSIKSMILALKEEIDKLKQDIDHHIDQHPQMKQDRKLLQSITGIGEVLSRELVSLFHSKRFSSGRDAAAFIGLVPKYEDSGQHKGRTRISKIGPSRVRAKLYMAAVVACQHNARIRAHYERLLSRGKTKMQALCAAMRKLVEIGFGVIKRQSEYQPQMI